MKKIFIIFILVSIVAFAKEASNRLFLFVKSSPDKIELKWFMQKYSSKYHYKVYRSAKGEKKKLLQVVKPVKYDVLKKRGYDDDYIFMIYPKRGIKNINDSIEVAKIINNVDGFRLIKFMHDISFARNMGGYYADYGIKQNKLYLYTVVAYDGKKEIDKKAVYAHTFKQGIKSDFLWVQYKTTSDGVELRWDVSKYYNYYNVYRKKQGEKKFVKLNQELIFVSKEYSKKAKYLYKDKTLKEGESARYYITRVDMFAKEGLPSKEILVRFKKVSAKPSTPRDIFVVNSARKIKIRWAKNPNVLGFNIYRSTIYNGNFVKLNKQPVKENYFIDKNFKTKKDYYYYVTSLNLHGESIPSTKVLAYARDTVKPSKPVNLQATVKPGTVSLKWDKSKEKDVIGYRIYVSMDKDAKRWELINDKPVKNNFFEHKRSKKLSRFPYFYRVTAVDSSFNESFASNIVKIKLPDVTPPQQPFVKKFRAYSNKIVLEWNQIIVYDFDHYNVYRKNNKGYEKLNKKPLVNSLFIDRNPKKGVNEYVITAVDKSGNESSKSKTRIVKLKDITPVKVENFKLEKSPRGIKASFTCKDKDYAGFKLYRREVQEPDYYSVSDFVKSKNYTDTKISKKAKYFYMVKAYDKSGNISESRVLSIEVK